MITFKDLKEQMFEEFIINSKVDEVLIHDILTASSKKAIEKVIQSHGTKKIHEFCKVNLTHELSVLGVFYSMPTVPSQISFI